MTSSARAAATDGPPSRTLDIGVYGFRGVPSTYSGYETFLTVLLPELAVRGHKVTAYCRYHKVEHLPSYRGVRKSFLPSLDTKELGTLTHGLISSLVARVRRHDVVLVVNPANAIYCALAKFSGQAVVLNTDGQEWIRGKWGPFGRFFFKSSARFAGKLSTALISDSVAMREIYLELFGADSTVIPYCWTSLETEMETDVLSRLGLHSKEYLCIAGRLIPENNAVAVATAYLETTMTLPLVVLGTANYDSPVKRQLDKLAATDHRIVLVGHVDNRAEYAELVRSSKVYIHAHSVGGINPSLVEAMGVGAAIISYGTAFNREALGAHGRYFEAFDNSFITALTDRIGVSEQTDTLLRRDARSRALSEFSVADVVDAVEALLVRAADQRSWQSISMGTRWSPASESADT
jgi:glycosyltransferase involved in cell wall biosynthesis